MKQLTKEQAIKFHDSKEWEKFDSDQITQFQLLQDKLCIPFSVFHKAITETLNRDVYTHEFGLNREGLIEEYFGVRPRPTLDDIINLIPEEKRIIINP